MARVSGGAWFEQVQRVAQATGPGVTGPQLTAALLQDRPGLSPAMARRLSSAFRYAVSKSDDVVVGSLAAVEQLQGIERLDPTAIADIISATLAGRMPLSALQTRVVSVKSRLSAASADDMTPEDLVARCPERNEPARSPLPVDYDRIRDDDWVMVDAATYLIREVETPDHTEFDYDKQWCLLVSPHIKCAKVKSLSNVDFISRIVMALAYYSRVSVICSSSYEREMVEKQLRQSRLWNRLWMRHLDDKAGSEQ